ncbi:MAG: 3-phosphoserine/phosphohydroxythreonine transaminase [Acidobacteria bacterium]|nr:3-phosphoserine/phosphohydroxythreonine transaminase [Acidobacteriota bacterium]
MTEHPQKRVYNFSPGPAVLPEPVLLRIREEFLNFAGLGASVIEISHRSKEIIAAAEGAVRLFRELTSLPDDYTVLFVHGGGRMQFSAVPMNLIGRVPSKKGLYVETDVFSTNAIQDAAPYGEIKVIASSKATKFDRVPKITSEMVDPDAAYLHITTNNTVYGTRWNQFPVTGDVPLVGDATSEILSRVMDYSRFGIVFAGLQKNLGPSGTAIVVVRKDLMGAALPYTPPLLNYALVDKNQSMQNTPSTFNIYVAGLVLQWIKDNGGIAEIEHRNNRKAALLYDCLDSSQFYRGIAQPEHRSMMNITFLLPSEELTDQFVKKANKEGLYALKGYRSVGGIRASLYNAMPVEGVEALVSFMKEFERTAG